MRLFSQDLLCSLILAVMLPKIYIPLLNPNCTAVSHHDPHAPYFLFNIRRVFLSYLFCGFLFAFAFVSSLLY